MGKNRFVYGEIQPAADGSGRSKRSTVSWPGELVVRRSYGPHQMNCSPRFTQGLPLPFLSIAFFLFARFSLLFLAEPFSDGLYQRVGQIDDAALALPVARRDCSSVMTMSCSIEEPNHVRE